MSNLNLLNEAQEAAATLVDQTKATASVAFDPPAAGPVQLRLVGYVEFGKHNAKNPKHKPAEKTQLTFELSGPKHPPRKDGEGNEFPQRITFTENTNTRGLNEKATMLKLFRMMNYAGQATHMSQLLGHAFLGTIFHKEVGEGDSKKIYANLRNDSGYQIGAPRFAHPVTGEVTEIDVAPAKSDFKLFLWDKPSLAQWDSIHIEGEHDGKSKNYLQESILSALNFEGSKIESLLKTAGKAITPPAQTPVNPDDVSPEDDTPAADADDPLNKV